MGRQPKHGVEYFHHDVDMRDSNSVKVLTGIVGRNSAIAFLCILFELLGQSESFYLDCSDARTKHIINAEFGLPDEEIERCFKALADMQTIDEAQWNEHQIVWCPEFVDRLKIHGNRKNTRIGPPVQQAVVRKNVEVLDTPFGKVDLDNDWARVEQAYAEQIGELPMGLSFDRLMDMYTQMGADVVIMAIEYTNTKQMDNPRSYLMRILKNWKEAGVSTVEQARAKITEHDNRSKAHMKEQEPPKVDGEAVRWING